MAPPLPPSVLADPLWAHLATNWKPIPKRPGYVLGVLVSAAAIVLLPLLYLAFLATLFLGAGWLLVHRFAEHAPGQGSVLEGLLSFTGAMVVFMTFLFMLKPLAAPSEGEGKSVQLKQFEELGLHSFVENVCAILGAPAPKRIDITCDVNASAGFRGGLLTSLLQRTPVLTIGLPLVAGMTKAQFAGVLAHEFGHFAQGTGMRVVGMASRTVGWFVSAVYTRDLWDLRLYILSHAPDPWLRMVAMLLRAGVFLARQCLRPIALIGMAMCAFTLRRMEFDADQHEIQFCGSAVFERSCRTLEELAAAHGRAMSEARGMYTKDRSLPNDLPAFVASYARRLTPEQRDQIATARSDEKRSFYRTHPLTRERVAFARELNLPGLFHDDAPARDLFRDFDAACRKATRGEFATLLGPDSVDARLVALGHQTAGGEQQSARAAAIPRYLGFDPPSWRPVFPALRAVPALENAKAVSQRLRTSRRDLRERARAARAHAEQYRKAAEELVSWELVRSVMDAGLRVDFKAMKLQPTTRMGVSHKIEMLTDASASAAAIIDEAGDAAMARLGCALSLLGAAGMDRLLPDAARLRSRTNVLLAAAHVLREVLPLSAHIRRLCGTMNTIAAGIKSPQAYEAAKKALRPLADEIRNRLDDARRLAGGTPDPFCGPDGEANLGEALVGATPSWRDIEDILHAGGLFAERYPDFYRRVLGELVEIAERTEKALAAGAKAVSEVAADADGSSTDGG